MSGISRPPSVAKLVETAMEVRARYDEKGLPSAGSCREISLAIALAHTYDGNLIAVCSGHVQSARGLEVHWWCRVDWWIVDASADQFDCPDKILVAPETSLKNYVESYFFGVHRDTLLRLAALQPVGARKV